MRGRTLVLLVTAAGTLFYGLENGHNLALAGQRQFIPRIIEAINLGQRFYEIAFQAPMPIKMSFEKQDILNVIAYILSIKGRDKDWN
jgi:hypothetical protein